MHGNITRELNPCVATFISHKLKCHVFSFYLFLFSSIKSETTRAETSPALWGGLAPVGRGGDGKRV
jgi:hypothetical protein